MTCDCIARPLSLQKSIRSTLYDDSVWAKQAFAVPPRAPACSLVRLLPPGLISPQALAAPMERACGRRSGRKAEAWNIFYAKLEPGSSNSLRLCESIASRSLQPIGTRVRTANSHRSWRSASTCIERALDPRDPMANPLPISLLEDDSQLGEGLRRSSR